MQTLTFQLVLIELQLAYILSFLEAHMRSTKIDKMHSKSPFDYFDIIYFSPFFFFFVENESKSLQWSLPLNLLRDITIFQIPAIIKSVRLNKRL